MNELTEQEATELAKAVLQYNQETNAVNAKVAKAMKAVKKPKSDKRKLIELFLAAVVTIAFSIAFATALVYFFGS